MNISLKRIQSDQTLTYSPLKYCPLFSCVRFINFTGTSEHPHPSCGETTIYLAPGAQLNLTSANISDNPNDFIFDFYLCSWNIIAEEDGQIAIYFVSYKTRTYFAIGETLFDLYVGPGLESYIVGRNSHGPDVIVMNESSIWITFYSFSSDDIENLFILELQWENSTGSVMGYYFLFSLFNNCIVYE